MNPRVFVLKISTCEAKVSYSPNLKTRFLIKTSTQWMRSSVHRRQRKSSPNILSKPQTKGRVNFGTWSVELKFRAIGREGQGQRGPGLNTVSRDCCVTWSVRPH